jgi:hypothetical protein
VRPRRPPRAQYASDAPGALWRATARTGFSDPFNVNADARETRIAELWEKAKQRGNPAELMLAEPYRQ